MKKAKYLLTVICLVSLLGNAQDKVLTTNTSQGREVIIKYYTNTVFYNEDIHYYRRQVGQLDWQPLHAVPVRVGKYKVPEKLLLEDHKLAMVRKMVDSVGSENIKSIFKLLVLLKSFEHNELCLFMGNMFVDKTAVKGIAYQYKVTRSSDDNVEHEIGISAPIVAGDHQSVAPPDNVKIRLNKKEQKAEISWLPESGRYYGTKVYRRAGNTDEWVDLTPLPVLVSKKTDANNRKSYADWFFSDDSLQTGVTYEYGITALDFFGGESAFSEILTARIEDVNPPKVPINVRESVNHATQSVVLAWDYPYNIPDLQGFYIYRSSSSEGPFNRVTENIINKDSKAFTDRIPVPGTYYYLVSAIDYAGNEAKSSLRLVKLKDITPPSIPVGVTAKADSLQITISWSPGVEMDLAGYRVFRSIDPVEDQWVLLNSTISKKSRLTDHLPGNSGNDFYYKVVSVDTAFNKSNPSTPIRVALKDVTPPSKPFVKRVSETESGLLINWLPVLNKDIKSIMVYRAQENSPGILLATQNPQTISYTDTSAEKGVLYHYYVMTNDQAGNNSAPSNRFPGIWHNNRSEDQILQVKVRYDSLQQAVDIAWPGDPSRSYIIYRKEGESAYKPVSNLLKETRYQDKSVKPGGRYQYFIRAYGKNGLEGTSENISLTIN